MLPAAPGQPSSGSLRAEEPRHGAFGALVAALWRRFDRRFFFFAVLPAFLVVFVITVVPFVSGVGLSFSSIATTSNKLLPADVEQLPAGLHRSGDPDHTAEHRHFCRLRRTGGDGGRRPDGAPLAQDVPGIVGFRIIFILPLMVAGVASATAWSTLFNATQGWIDWFLGILHLPQPDWLGSPNFSMPAVIVTDMWSGVPVVAIIVLAALLAAPRNLSNPPSSTGPAHGSVSGL